METCYPIRRIQLNTEEWTPVLTPIDCAFYAILGTSDDSAVLRSSDPDNEEAWHKTYGYAFIVEGTHRVRWSAGQAVTYLKALSGTPKAIVEFVPKG
jgi:hypothetical protein